MHLGFGVLAVGDFATLAAWVVAVPVGLLLGWVVPWQHSSHGPQLTSHMLGDPGEQDPGVSAMYQYDWITCGWTPGVFGCQQDGAMEEIHTEGIRDPLWAVSLVWTGSRPMGRPSGLVCFGCSCGNRQRGSMLPPDPVSILTWTEVVPLLLVLAGSFMTMYTLLHCWELMLSMIISFGCMSPTVLQSIAAMNRSLCGGLFSVLALAACDSLPFSWLLKWDWWWDACRLVVLELWHFACISDPFSHNLYMLSLGQGSCVYCKGVDRCSWDTVCMTSVALDSVPGGCGIHSVPHDPHTSQLLLIQQHSMFCRSLVDAIPSCHGWPSEVACIARCWHLGSLESACIELTQSASLPLPICTLQAIWHIQSTISLMDSSDLFVMSSSS